MYIFFFLFSALRRTNFRAATDSTCEGRNKSMRPTKAYFSVLSDLDLYLNTGGKLQLHQSLDGLGGR